MFDIQELKKVAAENKLRIAREVAEAAIAAREREKATRKAHLSLLAQSIKSGLNQMTQDTLLEQARKGDSFHDFAKFYTSAPNNFNQVLYKRDELEAIQKVCLEFAKENKLSFTWIPFEEGEVKYMDGYPSYPFYGQKARFLW